MYLSRNHESIVMSVCNILERFACLPSIPTFRQILIRSNISTVVVTVLIVILFLRILIAYSYILSSGICPFPC